MSEIIMMIISAILGMALGFVLAMRVKQHTMKSVAESWKGLAKQFEQDIFLLRSEGKRWRLEYARVCQELGHLSRIIHRQRKRLRELDGLGGDERRRKQPRKDDPNDPF